MIDDKLKEIGVEVPSFTRDEVMMIVVIVAAVAFCLGVSMVAWVY
jgi:hypothetical protein